MGAEGALSLTLPHGSADQSGGGGRLGADRTALQLHRLLDRQSVLTRRAAGKGHRPPADRGQSRPPRHRHLLQRRVQRGPARPLRGSRPPGRRRPRDRADQGRHHRPRPLHRRRHPRGARRARARASTPRTPSACRRSRNGAARARRSASSARPGVGKSTLAATLTGTHQDTGEIRETDSRGRHTTSARYLIRTLAGGWLIDTPGHARAAPDRRRRKHRRHLRRHRRACPRLPLHRLRA